MEKFTEPLGHRILQDLVGSLKQYEDALSNGDLYNLETLYLTSAQWELELLPFTKSVKFSTTLTNAANACRSISHILKTGGNLYDIANFEKYQLTNVNAAVKLQ